MWCFPSKHSFRGNWFSIALRFPWNTPRFGNSLRGHPCNPRQDEDSHKETSVCTLSNNKENTGWALGRPGHRFPGMLSQESQTQVKPPARTSPCGNWLKCYHPGNSLETQHPSFYWGGPVTQAASAWHRREFETPRRKAGVLHKP